MSKTFDKEAFQEQCKGEREELCTAKTIEEATPAADLPGGIAMR